LNNIYLLHDGALIRRIDGFLVTSEVTMTTAGLVAIGFILFGYDLRLI